MRMRMEQRRKVTMLDTVILDKNYLEMEDTEYYIITGFRRADGFIIATICESVDVAEE